jgi:hypothetical protein
MVKSTAISSNWWNAIPMDTRIMQAVKFGTPFEIWLV